MLVDRMQTEQQLELLERRIKSELDYLKAQINPHALQFTKYSLWAY
jgi:LytS/YehU family sensor histidine kinase